MEVAAEHQGLRVGLAGDAEGAIFGFGQVGVGNEGQGAVGFLRQAGVVVMVGEHGGAE